MNPKNTEEDSLKKYVRLIMQIAKKYVRSGVEYEDLISCGMMGLIEADRNFDPERSTNFSNYAITRIKGRMYEYFIANHSVITVPTHVSKTRVHVEKMTKLLDSEPALFSEGIECKSIISQWEHPVEKKLPKKVLAKLRHIKDMVSRIAINSRTTYQILINSAYKSMVTVVSEEKLHGHTSDMGTKSIEREVLVNQVKDQLESSMGAKKARVLEAHHQGYSNEDIAGILFEEKHTVRRISRQAIRQLLAGAAKKAKKYVKE